MNEVKIFALSLTAYGFDVHTQRALSVSVAACTMKARSEEEAVGIGMRIAQERWPSEQGWYGWNAAVAQVPPEWYREA